MSNKYKKRKSDITFIIGTLNEEKRIAYPIKSFLPYGNILVVDHYSTDRTIDVAKKLGAKVIKYKNLGWSESKEQMDFIFSHVKTNWICIASADELIPKKCLELYKEIAKESKYKIVVQRKKTLLYEGGTDFINAYINVHFFRKGALDYTAKSVHERKFASHVKPSEILYLPPIDEYCIYHFSVYTTERLINSVNIYSSFQARFVPKKFLRIKLIILPLLSFIWHYFLGGLFKIGMKGFIISKQFALYEFLTYSKAYEVQKSINYETIENSFVKEKKWLLRHNPKTNLIKKACAYILVFFISRVHRWYKFRNKSLES